MGSVNLDPANVEDERVVWPRELRSSRMVCIGPINQYLKHDKLRLVCDSKACEMSTGSSYNPRATFIVPRTSLDAFKN